MTGSEDSAMPPPALRNLPQAALLRLSSSVPLPGHFLLAHVGACPFKGSGIQWSGPMCKIAPKFPHDVGKVGAFFFEAWPTFIGKPIRRRRSGQKVELPVP